MKRLQFLGLLGSLLALGMLVTGCATVKLNQENVENGKWFYVTFVPYDKSLPSEGYCYDESIPLEEYCYLVSTSPFLLLAFQPFSVVKQVYITGNSVTILPPGTKTIYWRWGEYANGYDYSATGEMSIDFESGQYYCISGQRQGRKVSIKFVNLNDTETVLVEHQLLKNDKQNIPSGSIITGIHAYMEQNNVVEKAKTDSKNNTAGSD